MQIQRFIVALVSVLFIACGDEDGRGAPDAASDMPSSDMLIVDAGDMALPDLGLDAGSRDLGGDANVDAGGTSDVGLPDVGVDQGMDVGPDLPGGPLGSLMGECGEIDMVEIESTESFVFANSIDFGEDPYDEIDFMRLSAGGQEIINDGNAGGSSLLSEVFAYEVLARCEMAMLLKTENEIVYDMQGKITDLLVEIDAYKIGVSVTRAVAFPRESEYPVSQAQSLLEGKLADIQESSENVAAVDAWEKQILHVIADETRHRDSLVTALGQIDSSTRADTLVVITVSEGSDDFLY